MIKIQFFYINVVFVDITFYITVYYFAIATQLGAVILATFNCNKKFQSDKIVQLWQSNSSPTRLRSARKGDIEF